MGKGNINNIGEGKYIFLSYKDDEDKIVSGYVLLLEQTEQYLKFKTRQGNIITISYNRLLKMKEKGEDEK